MNNYRNQLVRTKNKVQSNTNISEERKVSIIRNLREKIQAIEKRASIVIRNAGIR